MIIQTKSIQAALDNLKPLFGHRQMLPILSCVKLHTERNRLHLTASNLDEFASEEIEADGELKPCCLRFDYLANALSGDTADIVLEKDKIRISCGQNITNLSVLDANEFPPLPKMNNSKKQGLACPDLSNFVKAVAWAASDEPTRYAINSVLVESSSKQLVVVATNRRELALVKEAVIGSDCELLIPSAFASNAAAALARSGAVLEISENQIKIAHADGEYYCKQVEGKYPNYKQVIPEETKPLGKLNTAETLSMLRGIVCFGSAADREIKGIFKFSKIGLVVEFDEPNAGTKLSREVAGNFRDFTVALSTAKMLKILQHVQSKEVALRFVDELTPLTIEAGNLTVVTMPMCT